MRSLITLLHFSFVRQLQHTKTYTSANCLYRILETGSKSRQYGLSGTVSSIDVVAIFTSGQPFTNRAPLTRHHNHVTETKLNLPNLVPSPALTTLTPAKHTHTGGLHLPQQRTPIGGLHLLRLEHIRLHRSLLSGGHFSPKLKCCHSNTTPSSRLPPAGRSGRCKYRLWAAHVLAH